MARAARTRGAREGGKGEGGREREGPLLDLREDESSRAQQTARAEKRNYKISKRIVSPPSM